MVAPFDKDRATRVRRLEAGNESRKAAHELDALIEHIDSRPSLYEAPRANSDALDRRTANELAANGWDVAYLAHRFGLSPNQTTTPVRTREAA